MFDRRRVPAGARGARVSHARCRRARSSIRSRASLRTRSRSASPRAIRARRRRALDAARADPARAGGGMPPEVVPVAGKSRATRHADIVARSGATSPRRSGRTRCTSRSTACSPTAGTGIASRAGDAQSPIGPHAHRARAAAPRRRGCASPSPPASTTSRATSAPTGTWSRDEPDLVAASSATTSTRARGAATTCASTTRPSRSRSTTTARATRSTSPTPTCRPRTPPARGS